MLLVAGENGIGKRTPFDEYRMQSRGGKGIITMKTGEKTGNVVGALTVRDEDEIMLITNKGQMVRTRVSEIRETGRNTMGVKLIDLPEGEHSRTLPASSIKTTTRPRKRPPLKVRHPGPDGARSAGRVASQRRRGSSWCPWQRWRCCE